jgi:DNA-binding GntR family transcriptional regulator
MSLTDRLPALVANRLSEQVYDHLKSAIVNGRFAPGERLVPEELAAHFGVSLTPVRDALKRLEGDGLVTIVARRGVFITEISAKDVFEIFQIRQIVERSAVEHLDRVPADVLRRLQAILGEMERLKDNEQYQEYPRYAQLDAEFHQCLVDLLENEQLSRLYEGLRWPIHLMLVISPAQHQRAVQTLDEHKAIVAAIAAQDTAMAQRTIVAHLCNARDDLLRRLPASA